MRELSYNKYIYRLAQIAAVCMILTALFSVSIFAGGSPANIISPAIKGNNNTIRESGISINGNFNTIYGDSNKINGNNNIIYGDNNNINGNFNKIHGEYNIIKGNNNSFTPEAGNSANGNFNKEFIQAEVEE